MNLKISVARPAASHRSPGRCERNAKATQLCAEIPARTPYAPGPTPVGSSLASYAGARKMDALKNQQITRQRSRGTRLQERC